MNVLCPRLIEVALPVREISAESVWENGQITLLRRPSPSVV